MTQEQRIARIEHRIKMLEKTGGAALAQVPGLRRTIERIKLGIK